MEDKIRIAICEDTENDRENILKMIRTIGMQTECRTFRSGEELLKEYVPDQFDLLLMDIYMGGMTGVETVTKIRETDQEVPIAFITTSTDFALESYRLSVLKYIEKPFKKKDIEEIMEFAKLKKRSAPVLTIRRNRKEEQIRLSELIYLEQRGRKIFLFLSDGSTIEIYEKLSNLIPQLEEQAFFTPHKSYCINLLHVEYINMDLKCFVMRNGDNVPIRRESMGKAKKRLKEYLFKEMEGARG